MSRGPSPHAEPDDHLDIIHDHTTEVMALVGLLELAGRGVEATIEQQPEQAALAVQQFTEGASTVRDVVVDRLFSIQNHSRALKADAGGAR